MKLLVYADKISPRLDYVFQHIFHDQLGLIIEFTDSKIIFSKSKNYKINYSKKAFSDELFFYAHDLLFQDDIISQDLVFSHYKNVAIFFLCTNSALPFDPFASIFYMISRYEEYLINQRDSFGRFSAKQSISFKHGFLTVPVVDYWILFIQDVLHKRFPDMTFKDKKFNFINSIDIDNAYAYLGKGPFRIIASTLKDLLMTRFISIKSRILVLFFNKKDPYDTYDSILQIHNKYNLHTIFFFLLGNYRFYDRSVHYSSSILKENIKKLSLQCSVGIHPSVNSIKKPYNLPIEISRLKSIVNVNINASRQHFLVLNLPYHYRNLIQNSVYNDYSMGFVDSPGFRAGTSNKFLFFDLKSNSITRLLIHPFCVMDISLNQYLKMSPESSLTLIKDIISHVKHVKGTFISIWHNESLYYKEKWLHWDSVYENMIKYIMDAKH